jgi:hypothetical protein
MQKKQDAGARGRTRTGTPVKASGPKPGASTNFATRAACAEFPAELPAKFSAELLMPILANPAF